MPRDEHEAFPVDVEADELRQLIGDQSPDLGPLLPFDLDAQRVDGRATGHVDRLGGDALAEQVVAGAFGVGEMQRGQRCNHSAVGFLREGHQSVSRPQPGFHVGDRDLSVEAHQRRGDDRGGVALYDGHVRRRTVEVLVHARDEPRCQRGERLARSHHVEVPIGDDVQCRQRLLEHLSMLCRRDDRQVQFRASADLVDDRCQLDRLGAGPDEDRHPVRLAHHATCPVLGRRARVASAYRHHAHSYGRVSRFKRTSVVETSSTVGRPARLRR